MKRHFDILCKGIPHICHVCNNVSKLFLDGDFPPKFMLQHAMTLSHLSCRRQSQRRLASTPNLLDEETNQRLNNLGLVYSVCVTVTKFA